LTPILGASAQNAQSGIEIENMGQIVNVSNSSETYSYMPQMALSEPTNTLYVVWQESRGLYNNFLQANRSDMSLSIVYRTSNDGGASFGDTITLYNYTNPGYFGSPVMAHSKNGSAVYLAWVDNSTNDNIDIYLSRADNGTSFEDPVKIGGSVIASNATGVKGTHGAPARLHQIIAPQMVVSGQNVYVMWTEVLAILTKAPPTPQIPTNQSAGNLSQATMGGDAGRIEDWLPKYTTEKRVLLTASNDGGKTFGEPVDILNETKESSSDLFGIYPSAVLAASADNVYIVTSESSGENLQDRRLSLLASRDSGGSFEEKPITLGNGSMVPFYATPVVPNENSSSLYMLVTGAENKTKSVLENEGGRINPYLPSFFDLAFSHLLIKSDDAGATFGEPVKIANSTISTFAAGLAVSEDGDSVYASWTDPGIDVLDLLRSGRYVSGEELEKLNPAGSILVRASADQGDTFGEIVRLNGSKPTGGGISFEQDAGLLLPNGSDGLYVIKSRIIYHDAMDRVLPSAEVLVWSSADGGASFQGPAKISGNIGGSQFGSFGGSKAALLDGQALYVVWSGDGEGEDKEVFFRKLGQ
jgi:hypothetical protein